MNQLRGKSALTELRPMVRKVNESKEIEEAERGQEEKAELEATQLRIQLDLQRQFLDLQKSWAGHIKWQIWAVLGFQFIFVAVIGFDPGNFTDNINKLPYMYVGVILETLANIIALGFVVARFLFPQTPEL